jgi:hypothetical protein
MITSKKYDFGHSQSQTYKGDRLSTQITATQKANGNNELVITDGGSCCVDISRSYSPSFITVAVRVYQKNRTIESSLQLDGELLDILIEQLNDLRKLVK